MALLGEMYYKPDGIGSWYNLPRQSGIAYAAQESWVLNETIKVRLFDFYSLLSNYSSMPRTMSYWDSRMTSSGTKKVRRSVQFLTVI